MIFNSINFVIFFVVFFFIYYFPLKENTKFQNLFLLVASYIFYAWASWKILPVLILSTLFFYWIGIILSATQSDKKRSLFTTIGVVMGVGMLIYFKYANFFITSFKDLFENFGFHTNWHTFKIILPLGISFYTFRLLSYVIDINRGKYDPTRDIITFASYVAFFPTILSGPIDRPDTLIPQLLKKRVFNYELAIDGCRQILWGVFKKMVIADNCATYVNQIFDSYKTQSGSTLLMGAVLYTFQIYADFSGYSDMAIGIGKILGFQITRNFNYPLFAQNIAEYWRNWHISLTSWLTDYVFMPLNIKWRNWGIWGTILAIMITFLLIGLWHGDNWTFALFGIYHGLLYIPLILSGLMFKKNKLEINKMGFPKITNFGRIVLTFFQVTIGLILFRSETILSAFQYIKGIFNLSFFSIPQTDGKILFFFCILFLVVEWYSRNKEFALQINFIKPLILRWGIYFTVLILIFFLGGKSQTFLYFQF